MEYGKNISRCSTNVGIHERVARVDSYAGRASEIFFSIFHTKLFLFLYHAFSVRLRLFALHRTRSTNKLVDAMIVTLLFMAVSRLHVIPLLLNTGIRTRA